MCAQGVVFWVNVDMPRHSKNGNALNLCIAHCPPIQHAFEVNKTERTEPHDAARGNTKSRPSFSGMALLLRSEHPAEHIAAILRFFLAGRVVRRVYGFIFSAGEKMRRAEAKLQQER